MSLEGYKLLGPRVKLEVMGGPKDVTGKLLESALVEFKYVDQPKKHPKILLKFDNSSGRIFNFGVAVVGLKLKIRWGYESIMSRTFWAPIKRVKALTMGQPRKSLVSPHPDPYGTVEMEAQAFYTKVHFNPDDDKWAPAAEGPLPTIARTLARKYGYKEKNIHIQTTHPDGKSLAYEKSQVKTDETVGQFLTRKARELGWTFQYGGGVFRFHQEGWDKTQPEEAISYYKGPDLLSYEIDGDFRVNMSAAKCKAINPLTGRKVDYVWGEKMPVGAMGLPPTRNKKRPKDVGPKDIVVAISRKALSAAVRRVVNHARKKWEIKMTLVGNPRIFRGMGLMLNNFGPIIDGLWYVKGVEHTINVGSGYITTLTAVMKKGKKGGGGLVVPDYVWPEDGGLPVGAIGVPWSKGAPKVKGIGGRPSGGGKGRRKGSKREKPSKRIFPGRKRRSRIKSRRR